MSDPRYRDPRFESPPSPEDEARARRQAELNGSNAMWGWIAGAVVLAVVLVFVFAQGQSTDTASNTPQRPSQTTGMAPHKSPAPPATAQAPKPAPSTTGQGSAK